MDFQGPGASDYVNVAALNRAFLRVFRSSGPGAGLRCRLAEALHEPVRTMRDSELERLAAAPFLLLSLREFDEDFWADIVARQRGPDLLTQADRAHADILAPALSFLWHLARRNPYATRLVSAATPGWCRVVAEQPLVELLRLAAEESDLLRPTRAGDAVFWSRLLGSGLSPRTEIRAAAHLVCLQSLLTATPAPGASTLRAAACRRRLPVRRIVSDDD